MLLQAPLIASLIVDEDAILAHSLFGPNFAAVITSMRAQQRFSNIMFVSVVLMLNLGFAIFVMHAFMLEEIVGWLGVAMHWIFLISTPLTYLQVFLNTGCCFCEYVSQQFLFLKCRVL